MILLLNTRSSDGYYSRISSRVSFCSTRSRCRRQHAARSAALALPLDRNRRLRCQQTTIPTIPCYLLTDDFHTSGIRWQASVSLNTANHCKQSQTRMWANAQRDGRTAEYRWRPLFDAAVWLTSTTTVPCSNAAKTRKPVEIS